MHNSHFVVSVDVGKGEPSVGDSLFERQITLKDLTKHRILGAGTFSLTVPALQIAGSASD